MKEFFESKMIRANLRLIVIALIFAIALAGFLSILEDVWLDSNQMYGIDNTLLFYVRGIRTPGLSLFFIIVTQLSSTFIASAVALAALVLFYVQKRYRYLVALGVSMAGDAIFILFMKYLVHRPRPAIISWLVTENGFSFPSGHTFTAVCLYGLLTFFIVKDTKGVFGRIFIALAGIIIVALISFSRIYLGVHWPSDVVASLIVSTSFVAVILIMLHLEVPAKKY